MKRVLIVGLLCFIFGCTSAEIDNSFHCFTCDDSITKNFEFKSGTNTGLLLIYLSKQGSSIPNYLVIKDSDKKEVTKFKFRNIDGSYFSLIRNRSEQDASRYVYELPAGEYYITSIRKSGLLGRPVRRMHYKFKIEPQRVKFLGTIHLNVKSLGGGRTKTGWNQFYYFKKQLIESFMEKFPLIDENSLYDNFGSSYPDYLSKLEN